MVPLATLLKERISWLENPKRALANLRKEKFEAVLFGHLKILLLTATAAGICRLLFFAAEAAYWIFVNGADINYWIFANYAIGISFGTFLFYLFAGTFLAFLASLAARSVASGRRLRGTKYVEILKYVMFSLTPVLLFGWIPIVGGALLVWTAFLFALSVKYGSGQRMLRTSVNYRD
ncbi:MAG: hypothetical protein V1820_01565 [archaeon]